MKQWISALVLVLTAAFFLLSSQADAEQAKAKSEKAEEAAPNPVLLARVNGVNDRSAMRKALQIESLDAHVTLHGTISETVMTIRFGNPSAETLEGEFKLDMPLGSVVSGYALDVNGQMVDGVLVPPYQARRAYEQRVDRRVDPGIVEVSHGSRFSTRVFPILPNNSRTIRIKFATPLDAKSGYVLPFGSSVSVKALKLTIDGPDLKQAPSLTLPRGIDAKWAKGSLTYEGRDIQLGGTLQIAQSTQEALTVSEYQGEGRFFDLVGAHPAALASGASNSKLAILWDRSRSRRDNGLDKEIALLESYLARTRPTAIELIRFDSSGVDRKTAMDGASLLKMIRDTQYGGATSFAVLNGQRLDGIDTCLLFSDGIATIDKVDGFAPKCRMFSIASTREADRGFLGRQARQSGGDLIDLETASPDEALSRMTKDVAQIISVRNDQGQRLDVATLDAGQGRWRIIGEVPDRGGITISFRVPGKGLSDMRVPSFPQDAPIFNGTGALWAANVIGGNERNLSKDAMLKLARRYSVASPIASFIVLETPRDYAQAEIDPPSSYPKAQRAEYDTLRMIAAGELARRKENQLAGVTSLWNERKSWWTNPAAATPKGDPRRRGQGVPPPPVMASPPPPPPPPAPQFEPPTEIAPAAPASAVRTMDVTEEASEGSDDAEIVTTASRRNDDRPSWTMTGRGPPVERDKAIALNGWDMSRPYLKALDAAGDRYGAVLAEQERAFGTLPAFYLDVSGWLAKKGRTAEATRMAASALDLPARNNETIAIVAARLTRLGEIDRAIALLDQMLELETDRPQPRRTLALALIQRAGKRSDAAAKADLQRAFDLLVEIINTPWENQYPEIESIALNDANAIAPRLLALGGSTAKLPKSFLTTLDADVRVVVEWNTNRSDMDLWVDEPDGERIMFSHNRSRKGGYLSRDMTQGYGPEEYFIRKAPLGSYVVRINTYATDRLNPNGPTTVTARLYRNFGRANQTEEVIDVEVLPGAEGMRRIGAVSVSAGK
jgi:tetratricopeptide (TPR) repeat protein